MMKSQIKFVKNLIRGKYIFKDALITANLRANAYERKIKKIQTRMELYHDRASSYAERLKAAREELNSTRLKLKSFTPFHVYLERAQTVEAKRADLTADVYVAHAAESIILADAARGDGDGKIICDCIETPSLSKRTLTPNWPDVNLRAVNQMIDGHMRTCDRILTVGWELGKVVDAYGPPVHVIPNYRYRQKLVASNRLRQVCGIPSDSPVLLSISTMATAFEIVMTGFAQLERSAHLVCVGRIVPDSYREEINALAQKLQVSDRFHVLDAVPYEELTSFCSGATIGIALLNPDKPNNYVSLPNRVFDYMFSGVPIVSPNLPDIAKIIRREKMGVIVKEMTSDGWRDAMQRALSEASMMRENAMAASKRYTWESIETSLLEALGNPKRVTFLSQKDLAENNRTLRMAKTLLSRGISVKLARLQSTEISKPEALPDGLQVIEI